MKSQNYYILNLHKGDYLRGTQHINSGLKVRCLKHDHPENHLLLHRIVCSLYATGSHRCCFSVQWVKVAGTRGSDSRRGQGGLHRISWKRAYGLEFPSNPPHPSLSFSHSSRRERGMCINDCDELDL